MKHAVIIGDLFNRHPEIGKYVRSIADVVSSIGGPDFEERLLSFLSDVVPIDNCAVFTYSGQGHAGHLFTHGRMPEKEAEELARDYVEKFYAEDPNYGAITKIMNTDYHRFGQRDLSSNYNPVYRNHFFDRTGLIDKTSTIGRIEDGKVYCNFYRMSDSSRYSERDRRILNDLMPLATALIAKHYDLARAKGDMFLDNGNNNIVCKSIVHNVITKNAPPFDVLTKREKQVCERILLGYTATGIGLDLDIAPTSVATYRKRAYVKLGISSQNELFATCLRISGI